MHFAKSLLQDIKPLVVNMVYSLTILSSLLLENQPWEEHCSETLLRSSPILQTPADYKLLHIHTDTHIYKDMHSPPHPRSLASVALNRQPDKRVCDQPELDYFPCCKVVCLWYYVLLLLRCFSCSHTVLPKEHSLGVIFLQFPVFLSCLSPCHICMLCM